MNISKKNQPKKQNSMSKFLKNTLLILFVGILFSCSSEDDGEATIDKASIIGTWKQISETENGVDITESCDLFYIFTIDQVTVKYYDDDNCTQQFSDVASYTLDGNILSFVQGSDTFSVEVLELSATTLKIKEVDEEGSGAQTNIYIETYVKQ